MPRVKFVQATSHPDYGQIAVGEVLAVTREYARDYEALGFAEESFEEVSRAAPTPTCSACGQPLPAQPDA